MARPSTLFEYKKKKKTLQAWADEFGIPFSTLYARIKKLGWSMHDSLTTPVRPKS